MAIQYKYFPDDNFLLVKISGILDWEQLKDAAEKLTTSKEFSTNVDTLYDLREMDFTNITTEFEEKLILFRKHLDRGNAKIACVVATDIGFGMGRMYEVLSEKLPQQVRVFKNMEDAKDWMKT